MLLWASWLQLLLQTSFVLQLTRIPRVWVIQCVHGRGSRERGDCHGSGRRGHGDSPELD